MALKYHPDRNKNKRSTEQKMKDINWAYKYVLTNQFEMGGENIYFQRFIDNLINKGNFWFCLKTLIKISLNKHSLVK